MEVRCVLYLLWFGVPALLHQRLQAVKLHLLWAAQRRSEAFRQLLSDLQLVLTHARSTTGQQLVQDHAVREHVHLKHRRQQHTVMLLNALIYCQCAPCNPHLSGQIESKLDLHEQSGTFHFTFWHNNKHLVSSHRCVQSMPRTISATLHKNHFLTNNVCPDL